MNIINIVTDLFHNLYNVMLIFQHTVDCKIVILFSFVSLVLQYRGFEPSHTSAHITARVACGRWQNNKTPFLSVIEFVVK